MSLDERLFLWAHSLFQRRAHRERTERDARGAFSEPNLPRLRRIVCAIADDDVDVGVVDGVGGVFGRRVYFPRSISVGPSPEVNQQVLLLFATFAGWRLKRGNALSLSSDDQMLHALVETGRLESELADEMPGYERSRRALAWILIDERPDPRGMSPRSAALEYLTRERLGAPCPPDSRRKVAAFVERAASLSSAKDDLIHEFSELGGPVRFVPPVCWGRVSSEAAPADALKLAKGDALPSGVTDEREGRRRAPSKKTRALREESRPENPFTHSFEKVHTLEEYKGGQKRADGSDELADHMAGLEEIDLNETVLSSETARSVYKAGIPSAELSDEARWVSTGLRYDEWDGKRRRYLPGYCRVTVVRPPSVAGAHASLVARVRTTERSTIQKTRAVVEKVQTAFRWKTRQIDGAEIDIDAAVERITSLCARHEGTQRVYQSRRRAARELAVMILLDASLSTDAWVENRRVLDTARDAATAIGEAIDGRLDEVAFAAFFSDTHEDCRFVELKAFDETWNVGAGRLAALQPSGYTRMGPAIRHATTQLASCHARRRLLLVVTDGKPSDRDRYEGKHGESDVRQAVREAAKENVTVMALGIDPRAKGTLSAMFGQKRALGLSQPKDVAEAMTEALCHNLT